MGVHTFTHVNLANVPSWRVRSELDQTQLAIAAATGETTDLLRPPYSSRVEDLTSADWKAIELSERACEMWGPDSCAIVEARAGCSITWTRPVTAAATKMCHGSIAPVMASTARVELVITCPV